MLFLENSVFFLFESFLILECLNERCISHYRLHLVKLFLYLVVQVSMSKTLELL